MSVARQSYQYSLYTNPGPKTGSKICYALSDTHKSKEKLYQIAPTDYKSSNQFTAMISKQLL